jgi:DNA-binding transcriptional LysR family regulator
VIVDWKSVIFDWNRARSFLVTAEERSFLAASKALNLTQSTVSRQVAALENELGVALFERVGNGIEITPTGLDLIEHVRAMSEAASRFSMSASGKSTEISGKVSITGSEVTCAYILPDFIKHIREKQPSLILEIVSSNDSKDLRRREADVAIRNVSPKHPDLFAKKVKGLEFHLYASKDFIKKNGPFNNRKKVSLMPIMGLSDNSGWIEALKSIGLDVNEKNFPIISDSHVVHWNYVKRGLQIGVMPESVVNDKNVEKIFKSLPGIPLDTWVVSHRELKTSKKIRFIFDELVEFLNSHS